MSNSPGRPKGTRVVQCDCGRRVAGQLGTREKCPDCGRRVLIKPKPTKTKTQPFLLPAPKKRR